MRASVELRSLETRETRACPTEKEKRETARSLMDNVLDLHVQYTD